MRAFKIWNSFRLLPLIPYICIALAGYAFSIFLAKNPSIMGNVFATVLFILAFVIPILIILAARTSIDYDGERVLAKTVFGKRAIILNEVQKVDYIFHEGTRITKNYIELQFFYTVDSSEENNHISLFDTVNVSADSLIKGDYSEVNLLLLYNEIIAGYPDKKAKNADG
jgi:hypothetical protein